MIRNVLRQCWIQRMKKDEFVMYEGDYGDQFYIILKGHVSILYNDAEKAR